MTKKTFFSIILGAGLLISCFTAPELVSAASIYFNPLGGGASGNLANTGLGNTDPTVTAAQIVNVFLQVLGLLCLLLMLYAGFRWLWARGNEDEIGQAKDILRGTIIGLIVILGSYGVAQWFFFYLTRITNAT